MVVKYWKYISPYALAFAAVGVATVLTMRTAALADNHSLLLFLSAVTITAWYGGLGPSLTAVALSGLCYVYFIIPPVYTWQFDVPGDRIRFGAFVLVAVLISSLHSARVRAERAVRSLSQRLSFALESTKMGVWDLDLRTGVLWHSPALEPIYGRPGMIFAQTYEAAVGYVHVEDRDFFHRTVTRAMDTGDDFQADHRIVLPDGEVRWVTARGRVFKGKDGTPERLVAVIAESPRHPALTPADAANAV